MLRFFYIPLWSCLNICCLNWFYIVHNLTEDAMVDEDVDTFLFFYCDLCCCLMLYNRVFIEVLYVECGHSEWFLGWKKLLLMMMIMMIAVVVVGSGGSGGGSDDDDDEASSSLSKALPFTATLFAMAHDYQISLWRKMIWFCYQTTIIFNMNKERGYINAFVVALNCAIPMKNNFFRVAFTLIHTFKVLAEQITTQKYFPGFYNIIFVNGRQEKRNKIRHDT